MKALTYLMFTQIKNRILSLRKKPALLILYSLVLLIIIGSIISVVFVNSRQLNRTFYDSRILYLFLLGFGLLYLYTFTYTGLSTGSSFFSMADVGLLFVAPISNKKILVYGLITSLGKTAFASIFIFYQIPNLKRSFGYELTQILALFFIYIVMVMICQILSIGVYIFSNGNEKRKILVRTVLYVFIALIIIATYLIMQKEDVGLIDAAKILVDSKLFGYVPIIGWIIMFFKGVITGALVQVMIALALYALIGVIIISLLTSHEADYYEDVLQSTEVTFQRLQDYKEGRNISATTMNRKVKVKDNEKGLRGRGAFVFVSKHLLEMRRGSRLIYIDTFTILAMIGVGIAGYYMKNNVSPYFILTTLIYIQYFMTIFGRLKIELIKPYIYLIPESSIKKLFAASISSLLKPCIDGVLIFSTLAVVGGAGILECIFMTIAYISSGAVFVGLTIVYQRLLGTQPNRVAQVFLGFFLLLIIIGPAVTVSILISTFMLPGSLSFLSTFPYSIICLIFAFSMFMACGNILDNAEFSGKI
jgi:hypothetical protein